MAYSNLSSNSSLNKSFILDKDFSDFSFNSLGCEIKRLMDSSGSGKILPEKKRQFFCKNFIIWSQLLSVENYPYILEGNCRSSVFSGQKNWIVEIAILFLIRKSREQPPEIFKNVSKIVFIVWAEKHLTSAYRLNQLNVTYCFT